MKHGNKLSVFEENIKQFSEETVCVREEQPEAQAA